MNAKHWLFTAVSFAAVFAVSAYFIVSWSRAGSAIALPPLSHLLAAAAVATAVHAT